MREVFIGRQAIYDRNRSVFGYELLFRSADAPAALFTDGDQATAEVIINALTVFGLEELAGERPVFVNVTAAFLEQLDRVPLPPTRMVLELLEDTDPTPAVIDRIRALRARGTQVALDDYVHHPGLAPLVGLADYVKVELPAHTDSALPGVVADLRRTGARLLAEKVETPATFERCRALGFDLFQGYFLARPENIRSSDLPSASVPLLELLGELQCPEVTADRLEALIKRDVALYYRLLRYLNSPHFPVRRRIDSIRHAVTLLGTEELCRWAALMVLSAVHSRPDELAVTVMIRARLAEQLTARVPAVKPGTAFMAGLLSGLDVLLGAPMDAILARLHLEPALAAAITRHEGPTGVLLAAVLAFEQGDYAGLLALDIHAAEANAAYLEAIRWSENVRAQW